MQKRADLLISNGLIVVMDPQMATYYPGSIAVDGGLIVAAGSSEIIDPQYLADTKIDATGKIVMPGLISCHTHAALSVLRGMADDTPLQPRLQIIIWPILAQMTESESYAAARLGCLEMLRAGITTFLDMWNFIGATVAAVEEAGLRACLSPYIMGLGDMGRGDRELAQNVRDWRLYHGRANGRISIWFGPHTPYTCSEHLLRQVQELATSCGVGVHIHVAETREEHWQSMQRHGVSPITYLDRIGFLRPNVLAAHMVQLSAEDIAIVKERGVSVAHNPTSNMKLGSGIAPVPQMLECGIAVGLGPDGASANNVLDLFQEMKMTALLHKVDRYDPTVLPAEQILAMGTRIGAQALGLEKHIGTLEVGKKADIIIIDTCKAHLVPLHPRLPQQIFSHLVYATSAQDVETVIVDGRILLFQGRVMSMDEERVLKEGQETAERLLKRIGLL
ncbi:MAG: amidohydrolase [Chloroflexi bacterium]|nr:amidohydrolase [Chloroflexota bacterium]MCL5075887.1 amidohydrolase [Chloroflexota bacterium]